MTLCGSAVLHSSANSFRETADQTAFTYKQCGNWGTKDKNISPNIQVSQDRCSCLLNSDLNISVRVVLDLKISGLVMQ